MCMTNKNVSSSTYAIKSQIDKLGYYNQLRCPSLKSQCYHVCPINHGHIYMQGNGDVDLKKKIFLKSKHLAYNP